METPLHPALVHAPLGICLIVPLVLLAVVWGHHRFAWPRSVLALPVALQALVFAGALLAMRTGEGEEERVEDRVPAVALERHEDLAAAFTWSAGGVLLLLAFGALVPAGRAGRAVRIVAGVGSLAVCGLGLATGHAGGELVYVHGAVGTPAGGGDGKPLRGDDDR